MSDGSTSILLILFFFICNNVFTILVVLFGFTSDFLVWLFNLLTRRNEIENRKIENENVDGEFFTIIIGTGFSGIGTAIKLNEIGVRNYILIDRNEHLGGTWYLNNYPGCACDVPSNLYSFSFEPNPNWSNYFGRQNEIREYLEFCARKYKILEKIRFGTNVEEIRWLDDRRVWRVKCSSKSVENIFYGRFVVAATGPLCTPSFPKDIEGVDRFSGEHFHTARWKKNFQFEGKNVAIVGTGASAVQVVPSLSKLPLKNLFVFQRTAPWVVPRIDRNVTEFEKKIFSRFPFLQNLIRRFVYWSRESYVFSFVYRWPIRFVNQRLVEHNLRTEVKNENLRKKLTPKWELGCKRVLVTSDWYPALQKSNVHLVTDRILRVNENGILTDKNQQIQLDVIIWSTGFETQQFSLKTFGIGSCSLEKQWEKTMQAYRGMTVPNFPNLFILLGPNSRLGHSSVLIMLEAQLKYLIETLIYLDKHKFRTAMIKSSVNDEYNRWIQDRLKSTVWFLGGCKSWYQDAQGNVTTLWPDFTWRFRRLMSKFDPENYVLN